MSLALIVISACMPSGSSSLSSKDSWTDPVQHGTLQLGGVPNGAAFSEAERYHAWTFDLSAPAEVALWTGDLEAGVDTVMYVYHRPPGVLEWSSYVAKNDDHDGSPASRVELALEAGQVTVQLVAAKEHQFGAFSVFGSCAGDGCPAVAECDPDEPMAIPDEAPFTVSTVDALVRAVEGAPTGPATGVSVAFDDRCDAGALGAYAVELYVHHWTEVLDVDEMLEGYDGEPVTFNVDLGLHQAGAVVSVDIGADEDRVRFFFDESDVLVGYAHDEQSPTSYWHYEPDAATALDEPEADCVLKLARVAPHGDLASVDATGADDLPDAVAAAVATFGMMHDLDGDDIAVTYTTWADDGGDVAKVALDGGGHALEGYVAQDWSDTYSLVTVREDGEATLVCNDLD